MSRDRRPGRAKLRGFQSALNRNPDRRKRMAELTQHAGTCKDLIGVDELRELQSGEACWCPAVSLELWHGAGGDHEADAGTPDRCGSMECRL
jgi:hypothetical protein